MSLSETVFELRRYRLKPGGREPLVELFEREFLETQKAAGISVLAQFREIDDPDAFVWLRSFPDMAKRAEALTTFYGGETWKSHRSAANATMVNSDNVLLLKEARGVTSFAKAESFRSPLHHGRPQNGLVTCTTCSIAPEAQNGFLENFESRVRPVLESSGVQIDALLTTEKRPNNFPGLPVREGETVVVWFSSFFDEADYRSTSERLAQLPEWREQIFPELDAWLWCPVETTKLKPTDRSRYPG